MTVLVPETTPTTDEPGDDALTHVVSACNEDIALCGADVAGQIWAGESEEVDCIVCRDLMNYDCPRCG